MLKKLHMSALILVFLTVLSYIPAGAAESVPPAVTTNEHAGFFLNRALSMLDTKLGMRISNPVKIHLVSGKKLDEIVDKSPYRGSVIGIHTMEGNTHVVYMMENQGRDSFFGTLCHELTHGWQREKGLQQSIELTEGLAVWVQYKCLIWDGAYALAESLNRNMADPVYGVGYRFVQSLEKLHGEKGVLPAIIKLKTIPAK